ncbi:MAG: lipopolysaccharide biosynthesis protein [Mucilaginibacter sp.]|jgi:uncharacterized protein involved in exopolysaccharide biosynthesis|nr:lipopolysaccharide biosynthesis protein [Mucilaginibacter sp.]
MEIKSFLKLVNKYKWLLILVPAIAVTVTYFLVQNLPNLYKSDAQIATGLLDPSKKVISNETVDFYKISQEFSSIMEKLKMKKIINVLSYNLILHDLEEPTKSFRKFSEKIDSLNHKDRDSIITLYEQKLLSKSILTLDDNKGKYKLYDIVESMGYGEELLKKKIDVTHADNSDFINIEYISENPNLSAYVVNTLANEFITYYSADVNNNENNNIYLLDSLLQRKRAVMDQKNATLSAFKSSHGVLNLAEQSGTVDAQITNYEEQKANNLRIIESDQGAILVINSKLRGSDPETAGSSRADNRELINLHRQLEIANRALVNNGFKATDQKKIDSLNALIGQKGQANADENVLDPRLSKQALITQKTAMEIAIQQAKSSMSSIDSRLAALKAQFKSMVPFDANIANYERDAELATKDYMGALDRYNQTRSDQNLGFHLQIAQSGLPGNAEPSKSLIYIVGAGAGSFMLCLGILFIVFMADNSIKTIGQLERATKSKAIGALNMLNGNERLIREIWNDKSGNENYSVFCDLLRSLRFEIDNKMAVDNSKILGITSLIAGEGKTFIAYSLAYSFAMIGKKVLLIADELTVAKSDSKELVTNQNFETFLVKKEIQTEDLITILSKNMVQTSLLESQSIKSLQVGFDVLRNEFDIIIIDINSLHNMNITKEWLLFTEKNIAVFESGNSLSDNDTEFVNYIKNKPDFLGWVLNKFQFQKKK